MAVISPLKLKNVTSFENEQKKKLDAQLDAFINAAPDAAKAKKKAEQPKERTDDKGRKLKGRKVVITLTLEPDLLDRTDELAKSLGLTRTGFISMIIRKEVDKA